MIRVLALVATLAACGGDPLKPIGPAPGLDRAIRIIDDTHRPQWGGAGELRIIWYEQGQCIPDLLDDGHELGADVHLEQFGPLEHRMLIADYPIVRIETSRDAVSWFGQAARVFEIVESGQDRCRTGRAIALGFMTIIELVWRGRYSTSSLAHEMMHGSLWDDDWPPGDPDHSIADAWNTVLLSNARLHLAGL